MQKKSFLIGIGVIFVVLIAGVLFFLKTILWGKRESSLCLLLKERVVNYKNMSTNQEKFFNYLLFFLLSLTGLASLFLVKNNYLYLFILTFLILYWQRTNVRQFLANYLKSRYSFLVFLTLGMVGVLLFQVFSGSPRFYQRPVLTFIFSLVFYLPYFFLWYKIFQRGKISLLGAFFLAGLLGIFVLGLLSGKLTTTVLTAPNLGSGLLYVLLKAAGILSVVGALTAFPFLFFADEKRVLPAPGLEKKNDSGFTLVEILLGVSLFLVALGMIGAARHRQNIAEQKLGQMEKDRLEKIAELKPETAEGVEQRPIETPKQEDRRATKEGQTQERGTPAPSAKDEVKESKRVVPRSPDSRGSPGQEVVDPATCQAIPSLAGCEIYYDPSIYYDPYSDPNSPEYQAQLNEQWYASQQDPSQLFFNDPLQLWSQDPFMYQMFEGIYNFQPIPGLPF